MLANFTYPIIALLVVGYIFYLCRLGSYQQEHHLFLLWIGLALMGIASLVLTAIFPELRGSGGG